MAVSIFGTMEKFGTIFGLAKKVQILCYKKDGGCKDGSGRIGGLNASARYDDKERWSDGEPSLDEHR